MSWQTTQFPQMRHEALFGDRVVACFVDRPRHFFQLLQEAASRLPDAEAIVAGDTRLTWVALLAECERVAGALAAEGLAPGDRAAILMGNGIGFIITLFAVARLGAISVPSSIRASAAEIEYILGNCEAKLLIHDGKQDERLPQNSTTNYLQFDQLEGSAQLPEILPGEQDPAFILYTSGTTGRPKGAILAHVNIIHAALYYEAAMQLQDSDRIISTVPLNHVTGIAALISAAVRSRACLIVMETFKVKAFLDLAEAEAISYTLMVPALYNLCLLQPDFARRRLDRWRLAAYGGAPMPEPTIRKLADTIPGLKFANCYGATETIVAQLITPPELAYEKREYVGCPLPGTKAIVMNADGVELPPGDTGELWLAGPNVVKGYWNNPKATASTFQGGYWKSGDIGVADSDGFVRVLDRAKDMINRSIRQRSRT
jgi:long-chain acyl-CoA synthetase